ncbi:MAG: hypothetical protein AAGC57_20215 [Pseudomonadota bacterium]
MPKVEADIKRLVGQALAKEVKAMPFANAKDIGRLEAEVKQLKQILARTSTYLAKIATMSRMRAEATKNSVLSTKELAD